MSLRMYFPALILPAIILLVSCKKNNSTSSSVPHPSITGEWEWQYTTFPNPDTLFPRQDSSVQIAFAADNTFTLSLNGNERATGILQWRDTILVLISSAAVNWTDYAQSNFFNNPNPSEYFVRLVPTGLQLSKNFIIPGDPNTYQTPIEPQIMQFIPASNSAGVNSPDRHIVN